MSFITGIGKGLREPVSPYRTAYFFGAELNSVNADNWNAIPTIWDPATAFDLSTISINHEVVVALFSASGLAEGSYTFNFKWYRNRDIALLYEWTGSFSVLAGGWVYSYSYIGWTAYEISEDGGYFVDIIVTGPESFTQTLNFTVSGIPVVAPPAPVIGPFVDVIFSLVENISNLFYSACDTVKGWVWPLNLLQHPLYALCVSFWNLLAPIAGFGIWVADVTARVANILSQVDIISLLRRWLTYAENAWNWVVNAWQNVVNIIADWWLEVSTLVQGWIGTATQGLPELLVAWNNFWTITLPTLISSIGLAQWWASRLLDIETILNSAFTRRENLWLGWQDYRDSVVKFFTDPVEFIWDKFTDWFLGPEV